MSKIKVEKLSDEKLKSLRVESWPVWESEPTSFDWEYGEQESCYIIEGAATVETDSGSAAFGAGDFVVFSKGLKCRWNVSKKIRKHYKLG